MEWAAPDETLAEGLVLMSSSVAGWWGGLRWPQGKEELQGIPLGIWAQQHLPTEGALVHFLKQPLSAEFSSVGAQVIIPWIPPPKQH